MAYAVIVQFHKLPYSSAGITVQRIGSDQFARPLQMTLRFDLLVRTICVAVCDRFVTASNRKIILLFMTSDLL